MKLIKQIIAITTFAMLVLISCTSTDNETLELQELNFDINGYQEKSSYLKSEKFNKYKDFNSFKNNVLNSQEKSGETFTEEDFNQTENLLIDLNVFDNDITPLVLAENVTNHLYQNNYISNRIRLFLNSAFEEGNLTNTDIQNFINSEELSITEINFLNTFLNFSTIQPKSWGCWLGANIYGALVGATASACCTPIVGAIAGAVAATVAEDVCNSIVDSMDNGNNNP